MTCFPLHQTGMLFLLQIIFIFTHSHIVIYMSKHSIDVINILIQNLLHFIYSNTSLHLRCSKSAFSNTPKQYFHRGKILHWIPAFRSTIIRYSRVLKAFPGYLTSKIWPENIPNCLCYHPQKQKHHTNKCYSTAYIFSPHQSIAFFALKSTYIHVYHILHNFKS